MCLVAIAASAQHKAEIEVSYDWTSFNRNGYEITRQMTLLAGQTFSKFYDAAGEYVDSLRSTPSGLKQYQEMASAYMSAGNLSALPQKTVFLYIVKDIKNAAITVYDGNQEIGEYKFKYNEPVEPQVWNRNNESTKNILGYECFKATCNWRGRTWNVWFSPEIPLDNGPWKLSGLPGLILQAEDAIGQHAFKATGIVSSNKEIIPNPGSYTYESIPRVEMLKILRKYDEDPIGVFNAVADGAFAGEVSTPISANCDLLEIDYR